MKSFEGNKILQFPYLKFEKRDFFCKFNSVNYSPHFPLKPNQNSRKMLKFRNLLIRVFIKKICLKILLKEHKVTSWIQLTFSHFVVSSAVCSTKEL